MLPILNKYQRLKEYKQLHGNKNLLYTVTQSILRKLKRAFNFNKPTKYQNVSDKNIKSC